MSGGGGGGKTNPIYRGTVALCTTVTVITRLVDIRVILARAGGNRFAIEDAMADERIVADHCTVSRSGISKGRYYMLITSLFNHASLVHLLGNMLVVYHAGRTLKSVPFLVVFYGGGVLGNLLCLALEARTVGSTGFERRKMRVAGSYFGASGGAAALMAFMSCCFPRASVTIYDPFPLTLPNWMHTIGFAVYSSWAQWAGSDESVAHLGHLGGLIWGIAYFTVKFQRLPWV